MLFRRLKRWGGARTVCRFTTRHARKYQTNNNAKDIMKKITLTVLAIAFTAGAAYAGYKCTQCNGTGWKGNNKCFFCGGDGETGN